MSSALVLAVPASTASVSGLRGHVSIGPLTPVCRVGVPCSGPARNVTLWFTRPGRVTRSRTDAAGAYHVLLPAGVYGVRASAGMSIRPARVRVPVGRVAVLALSIDTGIR